MRNLFVLLFVFSAYFSNAQDYFNSGKVTFGLFLGTGPAWLNSSDNTVQNKATNWNYKIGAYGDYFFADNYAFFAGVDFSFNNGGTLLHDYGGKLLPNSTINNPPANNLFANATSIKYKVSYLEIPIGLKFYTKEFNKFKYYAELPLTTHIKLSAKGDISDNANYSTTKENITNDISFLDFSIGIGVGAMYYVNEQNAVTFGLVFSKGVIDVTKDSNIQRYNKSGVLGGFSDSVKNTQIGLKVGFKF